ncbi:MAG: aldehyde dehydrogenase family protein [Pirellulaceae bacterium]|jgi:glyceraldehyde-3-phosphate dehydrogenase (NADP+)|nr:aldehyde dehydrogenase family protein [Pirellulaceae bacterium]MDP6556872.1 aldehyde dehydrogenase family protein [Pirellulaceae bacterium]
MKMFVRGQWLESDERIDVCNPFSGQVIDTVPKASPDDVETALAGAVEGARLMRKMPAYDRYKILRRAADLMVQRQEELGRTISEEEGKVLGEGVFEASRSAITMEVSAEEAKRLTGELLPLDGAPGAEGKIGFTLRVPCGVVVAITPFNFPLNLVCHKVGPALAAGNSVIVKPASDTPLVALKLVEILLEAGLPPLAINCVTGSGSAVGETLCADRRVRKISFTGSVEVGRRICQVAGLKKVTMELGSNSPLIVMPDADMTKFIEATVKTGFANAGQVCISTQRVIAIDSIYGEVIERLQPAIESIVTGDQLSASTGMGPMVRTGDAERVAARIDEAVAGGARLMCGGQREGANVVPALLADVSPEMRFSRDELFGPAVGVSNAKNIDEAITLANDSDYGLSAGIFTQDLDAAMKFAKRVDSGNIQINWGPMWRADFIPYGGLKESGMGKEGPKYAIQEMTESKTVVIHAKD